MNFTPKSINVENVNYTFGGGHFKAPSTGGKFPGQIKVGGRIKAPSKSISKSRTSTTRSATAKRRTTRKKR